MNDETILNTCILQNGNIKNIVVTEKYLNNHPLLKTYLLNRYDDIPASDFSYREVIWRIKNNVNKRPTCEMCGGNANFIGKNSWESNGKTVNGYLRFCCPSCAQHSSVVRDKLKNTNLEKYGVEFATQNDTIKKKVLNTMVERYGVEHALANKELLSKAKITTINSCGVYPPSKSEKVKEKTKKTNLDRYGAIAPACNNKILEKIKETNIERYGSNTFLTSNKYITLRGKFGNEWQAKAVNSLITNGTINKSIPEDEMFVLLKTIFGDENVIHHYKSENYPFVCDFYIKTFNMYIEYQGTYYHNFCFYNPNLDSDKYKKLLLKCNGKHPAYERIIKTWVFDDVRKFDVATANGLNIIFIYPYWSDEWLKLIKRNKAINKEALINDLHKLIQRCINDKNKKQFIIGEKR